MRRIANSFASSQDGVFIMFPLLIKGNPSLRSHKMFLSLPLHHAPDRAPLFHGETDTLFNAYRFFNS